MAANGDDIGGGGGDNDIDGSDKCDISGGGGASNVGGVGGSIDVFFVYVLCSYVLLGF